MELALLSFVLKTEQQLNYIMMIESTVDKL